MLVTLHHPEAGVRSHIEVTSTTRKMNPLVRDLYKRFILVGREYPAGSLYGYVIFTRVAEQHLAYGGGKRGGEPPSYQDVWSDESAKKGHICRYNTLTKRLRFADL